MRVLTEEQSRGLRAIFGQRANFDASERMLYGHDLGVVPALVKPLVGDTTPHGVVQPVDEGEIVRLVRWAQTEGLPLVPRAKATSGYGGVMPIKGGIVVDFRRMAGIVAVDRDGMTATVLPGTVWRFLDADLAKHGLTLALYPTSYPSSTVGGWLAQGGAGIGSFQAGWFRDNVVSARVVMPDGSAKVFAGADVDLVSDAEGITGLVTEVTIRVRPLVTMTASAVRYESAASLEAGLVAVAAQGLPIWSVSFINPTMADLKNKAPEKVLHDLPHATPPPIPVAYVAVFAYPLGAEGAVEAIGAAAGRTGGTVLDEATAAHEWDDRFNLLKVKRLGPSLVPAEVVVPLTGLGAALDDLDARIAHPMVIEGVLARNRAGGFDAVLLGFIPHDERTLGFNLAYGSAVTALSVAKAHGGRAYSTGIYFTGEGSSILGAERLARLQDLKRQLDPRGLMNPGKVLPGGAVASALGLAQKFQPIVQTFANMAKAPVGERIPQADVAGLPADVAWYSYTCSQCGYCVDDCDQFYGRGWESQSPRGKWYFLRQVQEGKAKWDQQWVDNFTVCTTCELCNVRCCLGLPIEPSWLKMRGRKLHEEKAMTLPAFEMMAAAMESEGNIWANYRRNRADWFPAKLLAKHGPGVKAKHVYFAGCTASYVEPDIGLGAVELLSAAGVDFTYVGEKESCCGTPMLVAGKWDIFAETMKQNIAAVKEAGADTVIASCPACDMMWRHAYPEWAKKLGIPYDIKVKHYSEAVTEKIRSGEFAFPQPPAGTPKTKVTWHDSCHIGRASGVYEPPRDLIKAVPTAEFVELEQNRQNSHCCGSVLTLIKHPEVAHDLGKVKLAEADETGADRLLALCPCCEFQLRVSKQKRGSHVEVQDLSHFACEALGISLPDPHPAVREQWAVFEAMIALMTPAGFAGLMGTMLPELIDAMPYGMGKLMRTMGKLPGPFGDVAFAAMKPMFPVLFPMLMPRMMPKVMSPMLARVGALVPMPDYMREQMPDLMPKVVDNLMPKMLPDVVPLVTEPIVGYLRGRA